MSPNPISPATRVETTSVLSDRDLERPESCTSRVSQEFLRGSTEACGITARRIAIISREIANQEESPDRPMSFDAKGVFPLGSNK